jgi:hypothetical protein
VAPDAVEVTVSEINWGEFTWGDVGVLTTHADAL